MRPKAARVRQQRRQRPVQVIRAVRLLCVSLGVGVVVSLFDAVMLGPSAPLAFVLLVVAVVCAMMAALAYEIWRGKNWARIALLLLFVFGLASFLPNLDLVFARSAAMGVLSVLQCMVQIAALYLVFSAPGSAWYRRNAIGTVERSTLLVA